MSKTILITGSTDGIGKLAAIQLAKAGHTVYLHGRNPEKLAAVIAETKQAAQHDQVGGFVADLSDLSAVRHMAQEIKDQLPSLDVLINNAGVFNSPAPLNADGIDMRYVVNYLAPFILTYELLPLMPKDADARIINLSSAAQAPVSYDILAGKAAGSERATYAQSKLALTMWSFYLARELDGISVIALNPGSLLNTNMVREAFGHFWAPADKGAKIIVELAASDTYRGVTGEYYDNDAGGLGEAHADAYDEAEIAQLIEVTRSLLHP